VPDTFAMDDVSCSGSEDRLEDCPHRLTDDCGGYEGAGVRCLPVTLVGGNGYSTGNVFVTNSAGFYGPVCDDSWTQEDAAVACRSLGFSGHSAVATTESEFGYVPDTFAMDDVGCRGLEARLEDCSHSLTDDCGAHEGAGVRCLPGGIAGCILGSRCGDCDCCVGGCVLNTCVGICA